MDRPMKAYELLADPKAWIQGTYAKDNNGRLVNADHPAAVCWCIEGAVQKCYPLTYDKQLIKLKDALGVENTFVWNDDINRQHAEVIDVLRSNDI